MEKTEKMSGQVESSWSDIKKIEKRELKNGERENQNIKEKLKNKKEKLLMSLPINLE